MQALLVERAQVLPQIFTWSAKSPQALTGVDPSSNDNEISFWFILPHKELEISAQQEEKKPSLHFKFNRKACYKS